MRSALILSGLTAGAIVLASCASTGTSSRAGKTREAKPIGERITYPHAMTVDQTDEYFGVAVKDPYRWLEDPEGRGTRLWIERENRVTFRYLDEIDQREVIQERMTDLWDYERQGVPFKEGGRYFFSRNDGLQNQNVIYMTDSLDREPQVALDPNTFSEDGTVALSSYKVSDDGRLMVYGTQSAGSDWVEFHVRDLRTGRDLDDHIEWAKFTGASWSPDGEGFYYSRYPEPEEGAEYAGANYGHMLMYHRLGTPQESDELVFNDPSNETRGFAGAVTDDGQFLIIGVWEGTSRKNGVYYIPTASPGAGAERLLDDFDAQYSFIDNVGDTFYFETDLDAPNSRVIAIDIDNPYRDAWEEIIPESEFALRNVDIVGDFFFASYLEDAHSKIRIFELDGTPAGEVELPGLGSVYGFGGEQGDEETFFSFTGYTSPSTIYRYDVPRGETELIRKPDVDFDPENFVTKQVFYRSKDGTRIPMFITHKRGLKMDGSNPTYLYGYGGFNIALTPSFSVRNVVWMEMGGILAVANLRGGGEYGKAWHDAGKLLNKQNVFDDFIAAGEHLIDEGYTSTPKLAIGGRSNGGLLVGAVMNQRPDLFGACLPGVGVMDMLRFHKFTIGWAWTSDYGSPDEEEHFFNLLSYSPIHNIEPGTCYPPTFIVTADHDDRVVPAHSFKYAATLQAAQGCDNPILIRIETRAGHGGGKPISKRIEEATDEMAFLYRVLRMDETAN